MITVEDVLTQNKKEAQKVNAQNEELIKTGEIKAKKQSYLPWILLGVAATAVAIWLLVKGKKENGAIPG